MDGTCQGYILNKSVFVTRIFNVDSPTSKLRSYFYFLCIGNRNIVPGTCIIYLMPTVCAVCLVNININPLILMQLICSKYT